MTDVIQVNTSPLALQKRIMCTVIVHYFIVNFTSPLLCHDDVVCRRSKKKTKFRRLWGYNCEASETGGGNSRIHGENFSGN